MSRLAELARDARVAAYLAGRVGVEAEEQRAVWCRPQQEWQRREDWRRGAGVAVRFSRTTWRQELSRLGPAGSQWKCEVGGRGRGEGWLGGSLVEGCATPINLAGSFLGCVRSVGLPRARVEDGSGCAVLCHHAVNCLVDAANKARRARGGADRRRRCCVAGHLSNRFRGRGGDVVVLKRHRGWVARRSSSTRTWSRVEVG